MILSPVTPQQTKGRPMIKSHKYISKCDSSVLLEPAPIQLLLSVCKQSRYSVQIWAFCDATL